MSKRVEDLLDVSGIDVRRLCDPKHRPVSVLVSIRFGGDSHRATASVALDPETAEEFARQLCDQAAKARLARDKEQS